MDIRIPTLGAVLALALAACGAAETPEATTATASPPGTAAAPAPRQADERPLLVVHKTPWCGCCTAWAEQAEAAGFAIELRDHEDLVPVKQALGVPFSQASCHTTEVEGLFVEGHVPFEQVHRLLAERPEGVLGIAVPGMPLGSPGMEADVQHAYSVNLVHADGRIEAWAHYPKDAP